MSKIFIVDTSYCVFFRFHAVKRWYGLAHPEDQFDDNYDWFQNNIFKTMFIKKFAEQFDKLIKKYSLDKSKIIFAKDCPRKDIWRNKLFKTYKEGRKKTNHISKFFELVYTEILKDNIVINFNSLEADDCICLCKTYFKNKNINTKFIIVTGDYDLLQLIDENTYIYALNNKCLNDKSSGDVKFDLEKKIICGDKSDNIQPCFKRVGPKTFIKLYNNNELLQGMFKSNPGSKEVYTLNKTLIDFKFIPENLQEDFKKYIEKKL